MRIIFPLMVIVGTACGIGFLAHQTSSPRPTADVLADGRTLYDLWQQKPPRTNRSLATQVLRELDTVGPQDPLYETAQKALAALAPVKKYVDDKRKAEEAEQATRHKKDAE